MPVQVRYCMYCIAKAAHMVMYYENVDQKNRYERVFYFIRKHTVHSLSHMQAKSLVSIRLEYL